MKNVNCFIGDLGCKFERQLLVLFFWRSLSLSVALVSLEGKREFLTLFFLQGRMIWNINSVRLQANCGHFA